VDSKKLLLGAAVAIGGCILSGLLAPPLCILIMDYEYLRGLILLSILVMAPTALLQAVAWFATRTASLRVRLAVAIIAALLGVALVGGYVLHSSSLETPVDYVYGWDDRGRSLAPKSARVLHARRDFWSGNIYVHFAGTPDDIKDCFMICRLALVAVPPDAKIGDESRGPFGWWRPEAMKSPKVYSEYSRGGEHIHLWVNQERTEAYLVSHPGSPMAALLEGD
jgi:hypothetical protein